MYYIKPFVVTSQTSSRLGFILPYQARRPSVAKPGNGWSAAVASVAVTVNIPSSLGVGLTFDIDIISGPQ